MTGPTTLARTVIGVDHRQVRSGRGTGVTSYAHMLRQAVPQAGFMVQSLLDSPPGPFTPPGRAWRWMAALSPWSVMTAAPAQSARLSRDVFRRAQVHFDIYGRYLRLRGPSPPALMHWSYPLPLHFAGVPNLYSVLDLIPLLQPTLTPIAQARASRLLHRLRFEAAHLVTISETSRREIIAALAWPEDRITNTYLGIDAPEPGPGQVESAITAAGLHRGEYFLHVGTVERRKNIGRLIEAYRASGTTRALVLAGPAGWQASEALAKASGLIVAPGAAALAAAGRPRVIRMDWVERSALLGLMKGAVALLAPSLAEGFGLPTIEAMALGVPTLASRVGASQEVAGTAALLVDPFDIGEIAAGIKVLDGDAALRGAMGAAGRARAQLFSADAYAARLSSLYQTVLDQEKTLKPNVR